MSFFQLVVLDDKTIEGNNSISNRVSLTDNATVSTATKQTLSVTQLWILDFSEEGTKPPPPRGGRWSNFEWRRVIRPKYVYVDPLL